MLTKQMDNDKSNKFISKYINHWNDKPVRIVKIEREKKKLKTNLN